MELIALSTPSLGRVSTLLITVRIVGVSIIMSLVVMVIL